MRLFPRFDIHGPDGTVYLRRWTLLRLFGWKLMLHKMEREDYAREMHDHPWWFITLILRGGYIEQYRDGIGIAYRHNRPGRIRFNPARHMHLVFFLPKGTCWTLVLRGRRVRLWGFLTDCGWMPWKKYTDRVYAGDPVCEDEPRTNDTVRVTPANLDNVAKELIHQGAIDGTENTDV